MGNMLRLATARGNLTCASNDGARLDGGVKYPVRGQKQGKMGWSEAGSYAWRLTRDASQVDASSLYTLLPTIHSAGWTVQNASLNAFAKPQGGRSSSEKANVQGCVFLLKWGEVAP
jgi:hypothetical protein